MKTFIPKHVQEWLFNLTLPLWPLNITIAQLFILAAGTAISLMIWNWLTKKWVDRFIALLFVLPIFLVFVIIAFFRFSELKLIPFICKMVSTYFLNETVKYQINYPKIDPFEVSLKVLKATEKKELIEIKDWKIDKEKLSKLNTFID